MCKNIRFVSVKTIQTNLWKSITWPNFFGKGNQKWTKACVDFGIHHRKFNTLVKTR
jgi:hypothetical protein